MRAIRFSLVWFLGLLFGTAGATSIGTELMPCPLCGESYTRKVIRSWNFNLSNGAGPPRAYGQCPYCLYAWRDEPRALDPEAKERLRAALSKIDRGLSLGARIGLAKIVNDSGSSLHDALSDHFAAVCAAAVHDKPIPELRALPEPRKKSPPDKEQLSFEELLPKMLTELRDGRLKTLPEGSGDREMGALFCSADSIREGDLNAAEFFIRWLISADAALIHGKDYAVKKNFASLAALPAASWPVPIPPKTRVPLIADCLHYLASDQPAPETLRKKLTAGKWDDFSGIVVACCTAHKDRSVASVLASRLQKSADWTWADDRGDYFTALGTPDDLPALIQCARRLRDASNGNAGGLDDLEDAIRAIHLRTAIALASVDAQQAPK